MYSEASEFFKSGDKSDRWSEEDYNIFERESMCTEYLKKFWYENEEIKKTLIRWDINVYINVIPN